jgi:hypothetical protein
MPPLFVLNSCQYYVETLIWVVIRLEIRRLLFFKISLTLVKRVQMVQIVAVLHLLLNPHISCLLPYLDLSNSLIDKFLLRFKGMPLLLHLVVRIADHLVLEKLSHLHLLKSLLLPLLLHLLLVESGIMNLYLVPHTYWLVPDLAAIGVAQQDLLLLRRSRLVQR